MHAQPSAFANSLFQNSSFDCLRWVLSASPPCYRICQCFGLSTKWPVDGPDGCGLPQRPAPAVPRAHNQEHDITGVLRHTPEGRFLQVLEGPRTAVRHLYYHAILFDMRHHHCQVLDEGAWPKRSFATWTMGFRHAQPHNLRTLLGEAAPNDLGLLPRPYSRPQLLGLVLDFMKNNRIPTGQEQ